MKLAKSDNTEVENTTTAKIRVGSPSPSVSQLFQRTVKYLSILPNESQLILLSWFTFFVTVFLPSAYRLRPVYACSLGIIVMFYSYNYVPLFVPCFDIPVSLNNLFQRIASVYNRFQLSRFNKLLKENQIFSP